MTASPADIRSNLNPAAVDALADQLHALSCLVIGAPPQAWPDEHRDADRSKARFILMGLRESGGKLPFVDMTADLIAKVNAGAMLTFAVWSLPAETVTGLFKVAPKAFMKAYMAATEAYGIGNNR